MYNTIFYERLQALKQSEKYPEDAISQMEKIISENNGKPPRKFFLDGLGRRTISNLLSDLDIKSFDIFAPNGAESSLREIVLL